MKTYTTAYHAWGHDPSASRPRSSGTPCGVPLLQAEPVRGGAYPGPARLSRQQRKYPRQGLRFGRAFADKLKRRLPRPGDKWHLDEAFLHVRGKCHCLWQAVDQHGTVLDIMMQCRSSFRLQ
jgi:hypothetical protein